MKTINIDKNSCLRVNKRTCIISCTKGVIWVTYQGGSDIILNRGENTTLRNKKKIILQGIKDSSLKITT